MKLRWSSDIFDVNSGFDSKYKTDTFYIEHFHSYDKKTTLTLESYVGSENSQMVIATIICHLEGRMIFVRDNIHNFSEKLSESILELYKELCTKIDEVGA